MKTESLWYQNAVFYEIYIRAYRDSNGDGHGDLQGVISKLDYLKELGVDCIWLQPYYLSPLKDDGYDVADYYGILPEYGTPDDLRELVDRAHALGLRVIADMVLNHTSDQHAWFQAARSSKTSPYRDYYVWSDTDQKYQDARIIFLDTQQSNWTWDEQAGQFFWHRFYASQPDLNFDHPEVQAEMLNVIRYWLDTGLDGFRADAVPYLFEREGTNCENLPETHDYLKRLRRFIDENYPGRILLCEANQWPQDVRPYFGDGDEFHMGFHFPLMPRIFLALKQGSRDPIEWILERTPDIPENCAWCTFLRNHDELTLEMVSEEERQYLWKEYAPELRMRLNLGIRRRLAPLLDGDLRKIRLAYSLLFSLPGSPIIYYGDEIGMGDNIWLFDRNGVRTPMQWDSSPNGGFSEAEPGILYTRPIEGERYGVQQVNVAGQQQDTDSLFHTLSWMIRMRKKNPVFGQGTMRWANTANRAVAAYWRELEGERLLILNNLSGEQQKVTLILGADDPAAYLDLQQGSKLVVQPGCNLEIILGPHQYIWYQAGV